MEPLEAKSLDEVRAEIIIEFNEFHDVTLRRCYLLRQTVMQYGKVSLPSNAMEEGDNGSETQARKRENIKNWSDEIMKKIKELMDISDNRIGNMINDLSNDMVKCDRHCESRAERLQAQIDEIFCILSQSKRPRMINEVVKVIVITHLTSPSGASN